MDPDALFVYGSLQFPDVLFTLIDRIPDHSPAAAQGYLITGLTAGEWRVLDAFEDTVYELLRVDLVDGRHGWTYVCNPDAQVLPDDWSLEDFTNQHLPTYVERCAAWRQRYEREEQVS